MKQHFRVFAVVFLLAGGTLPTLFAQASAEGAKDFGIGLIQSLYDNQCNYVFDHLAATVVSLEGGQILPIQEKLRPLFCQDNPIRQDISNGFTQYQNQYRPKVYDHKAFKKAFPVWANHLKLKAGDYFFDGANPRAAGHTRLFVAEQQVRFVLRYEAGDWIIIGI
jgi:hypothetical protein